jgi:hypothetical protein
MLVEIELDRMRHIRLHERVNDLPDANYATLKYFLGHLHKYRNCSVYFRTLLISVGQDFVARSGESDEYIQPGYCVWSNAFWYRGRRCKYGRCERDGRCDMAE